MDREKLSRSRAMIAGAIGKETGFFAQYSYMDCVKPITRYPAIERACQSGKPDAILTQLSSADFSDPFWQETTSHMGHVDAVVDYAVLREVQPQRVIEIGSGRSTQVLARAMADNAKSTLRVEGEQGITCIDPAPRLSIDDLPVEFLRRTLNEGDVELARQLAPNDVLFIDSSHIMQPGTDVDIEFNLLFPELQSGVVVHIHDIFLPYEYPDQWKPRGWNEACGLAPWIASGAFEVVFPTHYMLAEWPAEMRAALPDFAPAEPYAGGSFWIRKT